MAIAVVVDNITTAAYNAVGVATANVSVSIDGFIAIDDIKIADCNIIFRIRLITRRNRTTHKMLQLFYEQQNILYIEK